MAPGRNAVRYTRRHFCTITSIAGGGIILASCGATQHIPGVPDAPTAQSTSASQVGGSSALSAPQNIAAQATASAIIDNANATASAINAAPPAGSAMTTTPTATVPTPIPSAQSRVGLATIPIAPTGIVGSAATAIAPSDPTKLDYQWVQPRVYPFTVQIPRNAVQESFHSISNPSLKYSIETMRDLVHLNPLNEIDFYIPGQEFTFAGYIGFSFRKRWQQLLDCARDFQADLTPKMHARGNMSDIDLEKLDYTVGGQEAYRFYAIFPDSKPQETFFAYHVTLFLRDKPLEDAKELWEIAVLYSRTSEEIGNQYYAQAVKSFRFVA